MRHKNHSIEFDWELLKCDQCIKLNRIKSNQNQIKPKWVDETNTHSLPICTNDCELWALILQCYSSDQFSRSKISIIPSISLFNFILKSNPSYSCRKWLESFSFFLCVDNENPTTTNIPCINVWQWKIFRANILIHESWQWTTVQICQMKAHHSTFQSKRPIYNLSHCTKNHTHIHTHARTLIEYLTTVHNFYGENVFSARGPVNCCK